jgi:Fic family protein
MSEAESAEEVPGFLPRFMISGIREQIGRIKVIAPGNLNPHLRKENRIRTIHSALAIEHNSLSLEQVTAIIDGKHILGNPNEIREVKNAYDVYEMMLSLDPHSVKDLLKAHKTMMNGLIPENGRFRSGGVGVFSGDVVVHMAPPARLVPGEIQDLFDWYRQSEIHPLIRTRQQEPKIQEKITWSSTDQDKRPR